MLLLGSLKVLRAIVKTTDGEPLLIVVKLISVGIRKGRKDRNGSALLGINRIRVVRSSKGTLSSI